MLLWVEDGKQCPSQFGKQETSTDGLGSAQVLEQEDSRAALPGGKHM